ncbi:hypothetical protein D3C72_1536090 [compost metagenome]
MRRVLDVGRGATRQPVCVLERRCNGGCASQGAVDAVDLDSGDATAAGVDLQRGDDRFAARLQGLAEAAQDSDPALETPSGPSRLCAARVLCGPLHSVGVGGADDGVISPGAGVSN